MQFSTVAVIGAGTMGNGVAQVSAMAGLQVHLHSRSEASVQRGLGTIQNSLARLVRSNRVTQDDADAAFGRIKPFVDLQEACRGVEIVIENTYEQLDLKKGVFQQLDTLCPPNVILGTNTSQFSITSIAAAAQRPERVIGTHFLNPPVMMRLVELIRGLLTSDETLQATLDYCHQIGKETVVCRKDSAGFITTRAINSLRLEAFRMYEEGIASVEDIDKALRLGLGHAMGPFETADLVGLDICDATSSSLAQVYGERFSSAQTFRNLVRAALYGRKSGRGWYEYDEQGNKKPYLG
ncbi:MAG: 3-hydroxyacyl-CoA dehydrogenase family protein [Chloroflexi bacterium]|nr:3-hydroxyacyl-CoA dehydrogenase family protein [Chloroflexota bacterium]